jgi:hypothetical protein
LFYTEILVHNNKILIGMRENYGQWINVLIALCTAGARIELAETFLKLSKEHNDKEFEMEIVSALPKAQWWVRSCAETYRCPM